MVGATGSVPEWGKPFVAACQQPPRPLEQANKCQETRKATHTESEAGAPRSFQLPGLPGLPGLPTCMALGLYVPSMASYSPTALSCSSSLACGAQSRAGCYLPVLQKTCC
jgi:hypothetical protein